MCCCVGSEKHEKYSYISIWLVLIIIIYFLFTGMNPEVDTSFLPDRDRDEEENKLR